MSLSRLSLFHVLFGEFSLLQIVKSIKRIFTLGDWLVAFPLLCLVLAVLRVHTGRRNDYVAVLSMYASFLMISLLDGSMSNHVVTSCTLCLLMIASFSSNPNIWELRAEKSITFFVTLLYLGAGIHKLNTDFFHPHYSCANLYLVGALSALPVGMQVFLNSLDVLRYAAVAAVLFELVMPLLILLTINKAPLLRRIAVLTGALFHLVLALAPSPLSVYPFSAIMLPIYVFLLRGNGLVNIVNDLVISRWFLPAIVIAYAWAWQYAALVLFDTTDELFEYPNYGLWSCSLVWNIVGWCIVIASVFRSKPDFENTVSIGKTSILILCLFGVFPLAPYFGIRNYPALAMFSNLRTEGTNPNQFFPHLDWFQYQQDWVEIRDTNFEPIRNFQINLAPWFPQKLKNTAKLFHVNFSEFIIAPPKWNYPPIPFVPFNIPFIELRRHIASTNWNSWVEQVFVEYVRHFPDGRVEHSRFVSSDPHASEELSKHLSFFERYFVKFRSFYEDLSPCRH